MKVTTVKSLKVPEHSAGYVPKTQMDLFEAIADEYINSDRPLSNHELYTRLKDRPELTSDSQRQFGSSSAQRSTREHKARWIQQTLKKMNVIERVDRGMWQITKEKRIELTQITAGRHLLAMSTKLGIMVWSKQEGLFDRLRIDEPIELIFTSMPYPILKPRAYGGISEQEIIDFTCNMIEPLIDRMAPGGNIALNLGLTHEAKSPAESIYIERLVIALYDRLGLKKMKQIIWQSNKNPVSSGPYATKYKRTLINVYEPILWFTKDPSASFVDTRVLEEEHTEAHKKFVARGGVKSNREYGDKAYQLRKGDYSTLNQGRLPKDIWNISNYCHEGRLVNEFAENCKLPKHAAKMPLELAMRVIKLLSRPGKLVFDPCAGTMSIPSACEHLGRSWVACEQFLEYIQQSFVRFVGDGVYINPLLKRPVLH